jgi:thiosulfate/3-mercaptopyruvate sulfurtransferase
MTLSPLIQATELLKIFNSEEIILIDASNGVNAFNNYKEKHLQGAFFVDLNTQFSSLDKDISKGGRHPLPTIEEFSKVISNLGITEESRVVVYDDKNGSNAAARLWWMFRSAGLQKVQVLNGGIQAAEKINFPIDSNEVLTFEKSDFNFNNWLLPQVTIDEVESVSMKPDSVVIDVRDSDRYNGKNETMDLIAGHIPGAINIPFSSNLDNEGLFHSPEKLRVIYEPYLNHKPLKNVIVHCGSGVTACHTILAIASAGFEIPNLFVGSWSQWSRSGRKVVINNFLNDNFVSGDLDKI